MLDYQRLDTIADSYIPLLGLCCLSALIRAALARRWPQLGRSSGLLLFGLLVAYGLLALDNYLQLWPAVGLDYSTHSAVALVLVGVLCSATAWRGRVGWLLSLLCYALLMHHQRYHSSADMIATGLVVVVLWWPAWVVLRRRRPGAPSLDRCGAD